MSGKGKIRITDLVCLDRVTELQRIWGEAEAELEWVASKLGSMGLISLEGAILHHVLRVSDALIDLGLLGDVAALCCIDNDPTAVAQAELDDPNCAQAKLL